MSVLGFLNFSNALQSAAEKLAEQEKQKQKQSTTTTTTTNAYIAPAEQTQIVQGAVDSAAYYQQRANVASKQADTTLVNTQATIEQGRRDVKTASQKALEAAALEYRTAIAAATQNTKAVEQFQQTYGSDEHKKQKTQLYELQRANTQDLIAAQQQQDQGGVWNWIAGQFKAEIAAEEARLTDDRINQLKANEIQATQQLAMSFEANNMIAANANAEELARTTMFQKQADAMVKRDKETLAFDKEEYAAQMQVLGMNAEAVNASMKRLDVLLKTNDVTTSQVQAEQQRILKETAEFNLKEAKDKYNRSEEYRTTTEQDFRDHQLRLGTAEKDLRTFGQMVAEQAATNQINPTLQSFMVNRNTLAKFEDKPATYAYTAATSGEDSITARQTVKTARSIIAVKQAEAWEKFRKENGVMDSGFMTPEQQEKWNAVAADYKEFNPDGTLNRKLLSQIDNDIKELNKAAETDIQIAVANDAADLQGVSQSLKAQNLVSKMIGAGADPEVAKLVASGEADKILLDIRPKSDARAEVESNIGTFINSMSDADVMNNDVAFSKINAASKYMAQAYKLHRTSNAVKDRFPSWRATIIRPDSLNGKSSINLEDAGSLQLIMREQLIQRRAKLVSFQDSMLRASSISNAFPMGRN